MHANYPAPPWILRGRGAFALRLVNTTVARQFVPAGVRILAPLPGRTIAVLCMVRYGEGSVLQYHELIVVPALVYAGGRAGFWVSHIYVDNSASVAAGRSIWGLPKQPAEFFWDWESTGTIEMVDPAVRLQVVGEPRRAARLRLPFVIPVFGKTPSTFKWALGKGSCRIGTTRGTVTVAAAEFRALGFDRARTLFRIDDLQLTLAAPAILGDREF